MKKTKYLKICFLCITSLLLVVSCSAVDAPTDSSEDAAPIIPTETADIVEAEPIPAENAQPIPVLSDQIYAIPSGAFGIQLPAGWNCSESGAYQVDCQSADGKAELRARITSTMYELTDESFDAFAHAELVSRYENVKAYNENERIAENSTIISTASWRVSEDLWESTDTFIRKGKAIVQISTNAVAGERETYTKLFDQLVESVEINPENLPEDAFYPFTKTFTARESFFDISVPTSWSKFTDGVSIQQTIVEGFLSPDKRASVQIAIYQQGININIEAKGLKTRETMFALYGYDLKNASDVSLPDGRERLTWYAARKDINGISDFDSFGNTLYVFSIVWEPSSEELYLPILEEILDSFNRE